LCIPFGSQFDNVQMPMRRFGELQRIIAPMAPMSPYLPEQDRVAAEE
jgi:hypothetical protein